MLIGSGIQIDVTYEVANDKDVYDGGRLLSLLYRGDLQWLFYRMH